MKIYAISIWGTTDMCGENNAEHIISDFFINKDEAIVERDRLTNLGRQGLDKLTGIAVTEWPEIVEFNLVGHTPFLVKEGWQVNPNHKVVSAILNRIKKNNGECPCHNPGNTPEDRCCPCKEYRENDVCHCKLYVKLT